MIAHTHCLRDDFRCLVSCTSIEQGFGTSPKSERYAKKQTWMVFVSDVGGDIYRYKKNCKKMCTFTRTYMQ